MRIRGERARGGASDGVGRQRKEDAVLQYWKSAKFGPVAIDVSPTSVKLGDIPRVD